MTTRNEIAGIRCAQPRTLEERIELAHLLRRRFRLSTSMLIDALDDRACGRSAAPQTSRYWCGATVELLSSKAGSSQRK